MTCSLIHPTKGIPSYNNIGRAVKRGWAETFSLALLLPLFRCADEAFVSSLPRRTFGLSEGLLVCMLFGMDFVVEEVFCQLVSIFNLQLQAKRRHTRVEPRAELSV